MNAGDEHRKVKYTKMVIREALFELLETKPLKQITVKSLCELADINRGTFYSHYKDIYDLVEILERDLIEKMGSVIKYESIGKQDQLQMFTEVFTHIKTNVDDYKIILLNPESSHCLDEILTEVYKHHTSALISINPPIPQNMIDYTFALLSSGSTKVILKWIENDFEESPEEMARLINAFTNYGIASYIEG
jgi:AcrR family transcriptional regulator